MVDKGIQAVFLVLTNLAFALPAYTCFRKSMWYECSVYTCIIVISGAYHYIDTLGGCLFTINGHCYGGFNVMYFLDHYLSYVIITTTVFLVIYPTNLTKLYTKAERNFNGAVKALSNSVVGFVVMFLMLENFNGDYLIACTAGFALVYMMVAVYVFGMKISVTPTDFVLAWVSLAIAVSMFVLDLTFSEYYWILHSCWHTFMGMALSLFAESKTDLWRLLFGEENVPKTREQMVMYVAVKR